VEAGSEVAMQERSSSQMSQEAHDSYGSSTTAPGPAGAALLHPLLSATPNSAQATNV
jgi:hypothetical protein